MVNNEGGCLCGAVRYAAKAQPIRVTFCHCKFCQRATGSAYFVEPVFQRGDFEVTQGAPKTYDHRSEGSGKVLTINFCATCGTKLFLDLERFPDVVGVYGGTFDDPNWFERPAGICKHIFLDSAQHGTVVPAGVKTFGQYSMLQDGTQVEPVIFEEACLIGADKAD